MYSMILLHIIGTNGKLTDTMLTNDNITKHFKALETNLVLDGQKCSKKGINVTHEIIDDVLIEDGDSITLPFYFPMDFEYYSCFVLIPNSIKK